MKQLQWIARPCLLMLSVVTPASAQQNPALSGASAAEAAQNAIAARHNPADLPALTEALTAAPAVGEPPHNPLHIPEVARAYGASAIPMLRKVLAGAHQAGVRDDAAVALAQLGVRDGIPELAKGLTDTSPGRHQNLIYLLQVSGADRTTIDQAATGGPQAQEALFQALQSHALRPPPAPPHWPAQPRKQGAVPPPPYSIPAPLLRDAYNNDSTSIIPPPLRKLLFGEGLVLAVAALWVALGVWVAGKVKLRKK